MTPPIFVYKCVHKDKNGAPCASSSGTLKFTHVLSWEAFHRHLMNHHGADAKGTQGSEAAANALKLRYCFKCGSDGLVTNEQATRADQLPGKCSQPNNCESMQQQEPGHLTEQGTGRKRKVIEGADGKVVQDLSSEHVKQLTNMRARLVLQSNMTSQLQDQLRQHKAQLKNKDRQIADLKVTMLPKADEAGRDIGNLRRAHQEQTETMQAAHAKEIATLKAQAAQAKAEYMQLLGEKQELQGTIYELRVRQAANQA